MSPELVAIVAAAISGVLTLLGASLSVLTTSRRERITFIRAIGRDRVERLQATFEQALIVLDRHVRNFGQTSEADLAELLQTKARLSLRASSNVRDHFEKVARALDAWAVEARQGSPRPSAGGVVVFTAGFGEEKHNKREQELWPIFHEEREFLIAAMRTQLDEVERTLL